MASDYGVNFGFRRSDESLRVAEGRFRTPTGTDGEILIGTCVEIDPDNEGYLRVAASNAVARPGICGMLLQEEFDFSIYETDIIDSYQKGVTKPNRLSVITNGPGTKVWFKNTAAQTRADGRTVDAVSLVDTTGLAVGSQLGWDGTTWVDVDGTTITEAHFEVTELDAANGYVEAVCLR